VTVVVDVLSFTTCVDVAVGHGASVLPYPWRDDGAAAYAAARGARLAEGRSAQPGSFCLSPASLAGVPPGTRIVLPSPNGSALSFAARDTGTQVVAACLRNAAAVAQWVAERGVPVLVVPAGERWPDGSLRPCVEDLLGAGAVIEGLAGGRSPEAETARAAFRGLRDRLQETLSACSSGRELFERGFAADVEIAAQLNVSQTVPLLYGEAFVAADMGPS
jgi:2-phosphosulfolactate phosphatase